ncbi:uncharacterized protein FFB20_00128 [Fusarium fujikuroi]|uniref:LITAF domain-containing protein n=2 Tax=Fusarium fujikuroi TaxID=5127 RepID=S0E3G5_GIBF5|nr:uncharacterized protein FFUJ_06941 [Fusarium fujikuroi IMI 58289]KLO88858.1 uncharacterized protein LW93_12273 [Fusarium fujikuroi]KLO98538.1 uncharacterized protein Y057_1281 [Fusarium fujikuroi]KLP14603.1 uncharacterized protein LW94_1257 [Fusarium fujikuroi]QGI64114.1 hypothetical protein CEK27_008085 [Fusarium fujikuroi]QGI81381.1 hypothetical protein CEK25_008110 [Fusarium fujikuroi]
MESPTSNSEHHKHHAHHSLEDDNRRSSDRKSIEFSSSLAKPPLASPPPKNLKGDDHKDTLGPERKEEKLFSLPLKSLKSMSAPVVCPVCEVRAMTITTAKSGGVTFAAAGIACLLSCAILSWVPFFISDAKDVLHQCGNCKVYLAQWHRAGRIEILAYPEVIKDENKDGEQG